MKEKGVETGEKATKEENSTPIAEEQTIENTEEHDREEIVDEQEGSELEDKIEKLQDEVSEAKDKYLRLYSEYDNFRRRTAKEKLDLMQTATEGLMSELLAILDDMDRAEKSFDDKTDVKALREGIDLISNKLSKTLEQQGLKEMDTKVGTEFDADLHEAITQIPAPKPKLKGKIVDTIEKGYYLGEKVIRYAKVVIGN